MEIKGKVIAKMAIETGTSKAGKDWSKQQFVIETEGEYPKQIAIDSFGKTVEYSDKLKKNQQVTVSIDISSREYNGKWYTNVNCWKIEAEDVTAAPVKKADPLEESQNQLPF